MGSICYDFLTESFLFDDDALKFDFKEHSDEKINTELEKYRNHILYHKEAITADILKLKSALKVFSTIDDTPETTLLQSALYIDQFIIDDPLFKLTHKVSNQGEVMGKYLGYQDNSTNKQGLSSVLKKLKNITPMIVGNYVKLLPVSWLFEPKEQTPIYYSPNFFEDNLPSEIQTFCKENAIVKSMEKSDSGGWRIMNENDYTPGIFVGFGEDLYKNGMMYHFMFQNVAKVEKPNILAGSMSLAPYPMPADTWNFWVKQSINRTAINLVDRIYKEISVATSLSSTYITDQSFTSNLIEKNFETIQTPETITTNQVLNLKLPFIEKIDVQKLMDIRSNEQDTFSNFRIELERSFRELRFVNDKKELRERQQNIMHELAVSGVKKIDNKLASLKKKALMEGAILLGGLAGSVVTGGWSLLTAAVAGVSGIKTYSDYKDNLKDNPSYLMWKALKK